MSKKWTPKELLYDLVSIQSDSFTAQEIQISRHIFELIQEQDYWKEHPDLCGLYDGGDVIGRLIPWALRRGNTDRTIILTGHMDCVEIESYGTLKPFALQPDRLKEEMLKQAYTGEVLDDLKSPDWCFGRGTADMKAGDACIICELFKYAQEGLKEDLNILFVAVHDEEHQAEGIKQAVILLKELKDRFGLDYKFLLNPEPMLRSDPNKYVYVDGSIGKMLPGIVVKGTQSHVGNIMNGLNSALLAANVAGLLDFNADFCCSEFGQSTPPPAVLYMKDSKNEYDVSLPNYTEIYAHIPLTKNKSMPEMVMKLKELCRTAAENTIEKYNRNYEAAGGSKEGRVNFKIEVMTFAELEDICRRKVADFEKKKAELFRQETDAVNSGSKLIQTAGFDIMERVIEMANIKEPLIVIGLLPPYVPPVNNHYLKDFDRQAMIDRVAELLDKRFGMGIDIVPYTMGLSDNSYTSCTEVDQDIEAMKNMVTPKELYDIPFEDIARITVPSIICGPAGKDFHTATERVYLPDVEIKTPAVIETIINSI